MKTIKDIILDRRDPGNLHAWAKTNEDHSIDLGIWYNGKWNFIGGSTGGGGAIDEDQFVHFTGSELDNLSVQETRAEIDAKILKYNHIVYAKVVLGDDEAIIIAQLTMVVASDPTDTFYTFGSGGYTGGVDIVLTYSGSSITVTATMIGDIIQKIIDEHINP